MHDQASRELELLVDRRQDLVAERARMVSRLRWHLHRIAPGDPDAEPQATWFNQANIRARLPAWSADRPGIDARLARDIVADIDRITPAINALEKEIMTLVRQRALQLLEVAALF